MKFRHFLLLFVLILVEHPALFSQALEFHRYVIEFTDKEGSPFSTSDPAAFLSQRAIDRRIRYNIPVTENDLPINPAYISQVEAIGVKVLNRSKWLNSISIETQDSALLAAVNSLPFVKSSYPVALRDGNLEVEQQLDVEFVDSKVTGEQPIDYGKASNQLEMLHGQALHLQGYKGESIILAVLDAGFSNAPNLSVFDSLFLQGRVLGSWNFVTGNDSVLNNFGHGTSVLSTIAANLPGTMVGTAPGISVYLFVTEDGFSEYPIEEHNWAAAAEWADSLGADMITSSLGYSVFDNAAFNHVYEQMDGNTTMVTRAADFAASKGMIVCSSAGNEGEKEWHYITSPADADSILSVGAVDSVGLKTGLSSHGPSSDGDIKPNVVAQGIRATVVEPFSGTIVTTTGTSLSNPIIAGLTACLWQAHPEKNNMDIIQAIEKSASLFYNPNDSMGYGIPNYEVADLLLSGSAPDDLALTGPLVYPNPFRDQVNMLYYTARKQTAQIEFFNYAGQKVQAFESSLQAGYNYLPITIFSHMANGLYFMRINFDDHSDMVKLLKVP